MRHEARGDMSDAVVTTERIGDVLVARFDDGKANVFSFPALEQLSAALAEASQTAKALVFVGRDGKFSAGFDLKVMTGDPDDARRLLGTGAEFGLSVFTAPVPVVLGVTGHALAMGAILTTCADYRVGAQGSYKLGLNEVAIGMPVPIFATEMCRDRLAKRWLTRCLQHAHLCTPDEAVDAGFLDEVVEMDDVETRAIDVATHLAATVHPGPFRMTRTNLRSTLAETVRTSMVADLALFDVHSA